MYKKEKQEIEFISTCCGKRADYVQGGGGNTSVKFDNKLMAIKASGYTLKEITEEKGYVTVNYSRIKRFYDEVDETSGKDFEKESLAMSLNNLELLEGMRKNRPSVEVGFHSLLHRCVIHTHSVYANIICCAAEGKFLAREIFKDSAISYIFVPYIDPGFRLTLTIKDAIESYSVQNGSIPNVIFMTNHGLITSSDEADKAIALHEEVNNRIAAYLKLGDYPKPGIKKIADGFESNTPYLKNFIKNYGGKEYFSKLRLYPDQLVYIGKKLDSVISFDTSEGSIMYNTQQREASVIEETLMGAVYVINEIHKAGLTLRQMNEADADFIDNWESENYRSKMIK